MHPCFAKDNKLEQARRFIKQPILFLQILHIFTVYSRWISDVFNYFTQTNNEYNGEDMAQELAMEIVSSKLIVSSTQKNTCLHFLGIL